MSDNLTEQSSNKIEFIAFSTGEQSFCLEITLIREIRRWSAVTKLPHTPPDVLGVMNLRGAVIPIFDLADMYGFGPTKLNERSVVIVTMVSNITFGLLVDSVSEIISIDRDSIQETPDINNCSAREKIKGVFSSGDSLVRIVNLKSVLRTGIREAA